MKKCFFWGAGGQARVLYEFIEDRGYKLECFFENNQDSPKEFLNVPILGDFSYFTTWAKKQKEPFGFSVAIGGVYRGKERIELQKKIERLHFTPITLIHPTGYVAKTAKIGKGSQLLAKSFIGVNTIIGEGCIVNTGAQIDHDCILEEGVHIMPGAILTGLVTIKKYVSIGAGAVILPRLTIGEGAIVGAGAVVTKDVAPYTTVIGNPAEVLHKN